MEPSATVSAKYVRLDLTGEGSGFFSLAVLSSCRGTAELSEVPGLDLRGGRFSWSNSIMTGSAEVHCFSGDRTVDTSRSITHGSSFELETAAAGEGRRFVLWRLRDTCSPALSFDFSFGGGVEHIAARSRADASLGGGLLHPRLTTQSRDLWVAAATCLML